LAGDQPADGMPKKHVNEKKKKNPRFLYTKRKIAAGKR
jgi:hypothetical protein